MYVEPVALDAAIKLNRQLGAIVQATSPEEFLSANPGFNSVAELNHLSGSITVDGFTVNIYSFVTKLIDRITDFGGEVPLGLRSAGHTTQLPGRGDNAEIATGASGSGSLRRESWRDWECTAE